MPIVAVPVAETATEASPSIFRIGSPILIALLAVALAPMLFLNYVGQQNTKDRLTDLSVANLTMRSSATAAAIDAYLQSRRRDIVAVSQVPDVIAYAQNLGDKAQRDLARAALAQAATVDPAYESIAVLTLDGTIMAASIQTDEGTNVRFRDYFQNARAGVGYVSDPSYSVITNKPALFFSAPVKTTDGVLVGVVRSRINLARIWDLVEADLGSVGAGARAFLVDDYGIRLAVSETKGNREKADSLIYKVIAPIDHDVAIRLATDKRFGQRSAEQLIVDPLPELKAVIDDASRKGATVLTFNSGGAEQRAVATWLDSKPWIYVVAMSPASYTSSVAGATPGLIGGVALGLALAVLVAILLVRSMVARGEAEG
jgi:C4-dicarboxylate-specific signal transduction histidine kinase